MVTALLTLAAEHAEPDKTIYFIAAGILTGWALLVSVLGMTQPDFPKSGGATRGVMGIGVLLTIFVMVAVLATP